MEHYQQAPLHRTFSLIRVPRFNFFQSPTTQDKHIKSPQPEKAPKPIDNMTEALLDPFTTVGEAIVDSQLKSQRESSVKRKRDD